MSITDLALGGRTMEEQQRVNRTAPKVQTEPQEPPKAAAEQEERPTTPVDLEAAVDPLKKAFESYNAQIDIQYRSDLEMLVLVLYKTDPETGQKTDEVVRQIPPEEAVELAQRLEQGRAMFLNEKI